MLQGSPEACGNCDQSKALIEKPVIEDKSVCPKLVKNGFCDVRYFKGVMLEYCPIGCAHARNYENSNTTEHLTFLKL